jgi:transcription initiation factor TFIIA small subunit
LSTRVKVKVAFKAEKLNTYRFCDNVWTFMLNDVEFRDSNELEKVDRVKVKSDFLIVQGTILTKQ